MKIYQYIVEKLKISYLLHPFLVFLFFLLHETNEGFKSPLNQVITISITNICCAGILFIVSYNWNRNKYLSSYLLTFALFFCLFFKYIWQSFEVFFTFWTLSRAFLIIYFLLFIFTKFIMNKYLKANLFLNALFSVFIIRYF